MRVDPSGDFSIHPLVYRVFNFPIIFGISLILSQSEAEEASSGTGLVALFLFYALAPPFIPIEASEVFIKIGELEALCGSLGIQVDIQFGGLVDGECLAQEIG